MSIKAKIFLIWVLIFGANFLIAPTSLAADVGIDTIDSSIVLSGTSPIKIITNIINVFLGFLSLLALILVLYGGFVWMTSGGSEEKISQAKKILKNGAIGLLIILSAWAITSFILKALIDGTNGPTGPDGCTNGSTSLCGCGGSQTCNNGTWGPCLGSDCDPLIDNKTSCDGKTEVSGCQADSNLCGADYICDDNSCLCKSKAGLGDSCNTGTSGTCKADDNLCGPYLKCDPDACVCVGPPVITGVSPAGGFCENDINKGCNKDADCSGGAQCDSLAPNGAANNFITIYGYNFGATTSKVTFLGANNAQAQLANFPNSINPNCVSYWTDRQIIVAVPLSAARGPIQVKREDNLTDNIDVTNNDKGPKIPDFIKNTIVRPGLCQISPTQGAVGAKVLYQGTNLKNSVAYFGEYSSSYKGINSVFTADNLSGQTLAPNIVAGKTTTFVEKTLVGINQKSNALVFVKEKEAEAGPYISSFYPKSGPAGQYVTILGNGFGNSRGSRQVLFGDIEASYDFPEVCTNAVWSNNQVIVKVPNGLNSDDYEIKINLGNSIINTDLLSPDNTFKVDPSQSLKTSICKIDPTRGQIGDKVNLWGENFGPNGTNASVVFNRGVSISSKISKDGSADKIITEVPIDSLGTPAITGPVHVLKNGQWGNEVNFTVGKCVNDSECNASSPICCPNNTFKTGSCAATLMACYFDVPNSVYETKFSTVLSGAGNNSQFDSCISMATFFQGCQTGQFCPNSPGKCSPFSPIAPEILSDCGSTSSECGAISYCKENISKCTYNKDKDVCQTSKCQLEKDISYTLNNAEAIFTGSVSCRSYYDSKTKETYFAKHLKVNTSCPVGWVSAGSGYCVNTTPVLCEPCPTNFSCREDNNKTDEFGICESDKICSGTSYCGANGNKFSCFKEQNKSCDCCCEIGQDARDCCAPLKCAGTCGSDTTDNNDGYGSCSGCSSVGSTQADHDAACNCDSTSGKICDTSKSGGVCTDCASLDEASCSDHAQQCCFDSNKGVCRGGDGTILGGKCAFYDCDSNNKATCNQTPSLTGQFLATSTCITKCASDPKTICDIIATDSVACSLQNNCCFDNKTKVCKDVSAGVNNAKDKIKVDNINYCAYFDCDETTKNCSDEGAIDGDFRGFVNCKNKCNPDDSLPGVSCASETVGACNTNFCNDPYKCLSASASGPSPSDCGICCCTPGPEKNENGLICYADKGNCTGSSRGLFCGCSEDSQCGGDTVGCGTDTCCYARPSVVSTSPKNDDINVCRNTQIEINFSEEMDTTTLAANILMLEEKKYGSDICPNGSVLSFNDYKKENSNLVVNLYKKIVAVLKRAWSGNSSGSALAINPTADKLYCITPITIETQTSYINNATSTKAYIQPQKLLAAKTNYFVVIKGDEKLNSASGVMSLKKIGLNSINTGPIYSSNDYSKSRAVFNGVNFYRSYAFGFTTMDDNQEKNGLCTISKVVVNPISILIKSGDNNTSDDDPSSVNFDKVSDNDRALLALAYSADNQLLQPVSSYAWSWDWKIDDDLVVKNNNTFGLKSNRIVISAVSGVTDKSTKVNATVNMTGFSNAIWDGDGLSGNSDVYVFLCSNPWPMEIGGVWRPWFDKGLDSSGKVVPNYNYKFYYCRDAGEPGTADDLPAVADPALILGSSGSLVCSTDGVACFSAGAPCGENGTCVWNVLKESYFFREAVPQAGEITDVSSTGASGAVMVKWYAPITSLVNISSFKVYYGPANGKTSSYVSSVSASDTRYCSKTTTEYNCTFIIDKLINGTSYSFKVSSLSDKKAESPLFGGKEVIPTDTTAPAKPSGLKFVIEDNKIIMSWKANTDDTLYYRLYHGLFAGKKAAESVDSLNNATNLTLEKSNYRVGDHYFFLAAIDESGNISNTSDEIKMVIPAN